MDSGIALSRPALPVVPAAAACCLILCALFALDLWVTDAAVRNRSHAPPSGLLPIATIQPGPTYLNDIESRASMTVEAIDVLETAVLIALGSLVAARGGARALNLIVAGTALTMTALALQAPATESADIYIYVGLAQSPAPYHPGPTPFPGQDAAINRLWGLPLLPSVYGPLWIAVSKAALAAAPSLVAKLIVLRLVGLFAVAACIAMLARMRVPRPVIVLFAVNPAVYDLFVAEGHNDMLGVAFILAAALARRRSRLVAMALCVAAGCIKLPFILIAMLVFASEETLLARLGLGLASAALSLSVSFAWAGPWYLWALRRVYDAEGGAPSAPQVALQVVMFFTGICAVVGALWSRRFSAATPWFMPTFGRSPLPQYLAWGLPAVFLDPAPNWAFLAAMPLMAFLLDTAFAFTPLTTLVLALIGGAVVWMAFQTSRATTRTAVRR